MGACGDAAMDRASERSSRRRGCCLLGAVAVAALGAAACAAGCASVGLARGAMVRPRPPLARAPRAGRWLRAPRSVAASAGPTKLVNTQEERARLVALGYSEVEAYLMRPELAATVLERGTRRPWGAKPMPADWTKEELLKSAECQALLAAEQDRKRTEYRALGGQTNSEPGSKKRLPYL
ncbi:unnamed protein product [Prorocentrum cordatum]|uniref:Uncharacterized protein n=1 Tax=Prorocentrum cordatum TaxID=2364126 RepID=A0ABN9V411_9DINO|nr:unnamed protein product [Polarella glacialis]